MDQQQKELQEIMKAFADVAEMGIKANNLGREYTKKYCPYKKGDILRVKPEFGNEELVLVDSVRFDDHGRITGLAYIIGWPLKKNFTRKTGRYAIHIKKQSEIIEKIK